MTGFLAAGLILATLVSMVALLSDAAPLAIIHGPSPMLMILLTVPVIVGVLAVPMIVWSVTGFWCRSARPFRAGRLHRSDAGGLRLPRLLHSVELPPAQHLHGLGRQPFSAAFFRMISEVGTLDRVRVLPAAVMAEAGWGEHVLQPVCD
jgi:hypothetical protein